jgi:hypothetical protein
MNETLEACHTNLQGSDLLRDIATGKTPRKKVVSIPDKWNRTKPHPELIDEFHGVAIDKENESTRVEFTTPSSKLPLSRQSSAFSKRHAFQELE